MNCPYCNTPLPDNSAATSCSACGRELPSKTHVPTDEPPPFKIRWLWFWVALTTPPVLTLLSALLMRQATPGHASNESLSPAIALIGGGLGGLVCGIALATRLGKTIAARLGLVLLFSSIMVVVSIMLCFFGCTLGGYQLDMK